MSRLDAYARAHAGRDPVVTYQAREVLLDCLANYDAGHQRPALTMDQAGFHGIAALKVAMHAGQDAAVRLGFEETDPEDDERVFEEAVEILTDRLEQGSKRRTAVAL